MHKLGWVVLALLAANVLFNWGYWRELFTQKWDLNLYTMDGRITEWMVETGYQRVLHGQNPLAATTKIIYPFETDIALNDPGMLLILPYAIFRPWMPIHQAMVGAVLLSLLFTSWAMYWLLMVLGYKSGIATLFALMFTYMPFVGREVLGHYTYLCLYLFPLMYLLMDRWIRAKEQTQRRWWAGGAGALAALFWYGNFYYGVSLVMALGILALSCLIMNRQKTWLWIKDNFLAGVIFLVTMLLLLTPWLWSVQQELIFSGWKRITGYGGAVQLSTDLLTLALPQTWGAALWVVIGYAIFRYRRLATTVKKQLRFPLLVGVWFVILTLGPFLKVLDRWHVSLEGIEVFFPLPFLLVRSIPGLENLRAPERFIPVAVFFACLVSARILKEASKPVIIILMLIMVIGGFYKMPYKVSANLPVGLYEEIAKDDGGTVLEIPMTVRDGYRYLGFVYGLNSMQSQLIFDRPVIGGYLARVRTPVFNYYERLSLIGYLFSITDRGNYNRFTGIPKDPVVTEYTGSIEGANKELDFLNVSDIVVKQDELYSSQIEKLLLELGAEKQREEQGYGWWTRERGEDDFSQVVFGNWDDYLYAGGGIITNNSQPAEIADKRTEIFLRPSAGIHYQELYGLVSADEPTGVTVYLDRQRLRQTIIKAGTNEVKFLIGETKIDNLARVELIWEIPKRTAPKIYLKEVGIR